MQNHPYDRSALINWYDAHSENYDRETFAQDEQRYGGDLYRVLLVADFIASFKPKKILDVGCGTAEPMLQFLKNGCDVRGFDLSPGMIKQAKKKLADSGYPENRAETGDILDPSIVERFGSGVYDLVLGNGVLPYIKDCDTAHRHLAQLTKPGGYYISAYSNALLDLVTFNRFTMSFHWDNFIAPMEIDASLKEEIMDNTRRLIAHPDQPASIPEGARDSIYVGAHNPLTIADTLKQVGLIQKDIVFYKFHAFAPLLKNTSPLLHQTFMQQSRAYELKKARDWRGYFLASTFIVVAQKQLKNN